MRNLPHDKGLNTSQATLPCHTVVFWQLRYLHQQRKSHGAFHEARKNCFSCIRLWSAVLEACDFNKIVYICNHLHIFAYLWLRASEEREFYARSLLRAKPVLHEHLARRCSRHRWRQDVAVTKHSEHDRCVSVVAPGAFEAPSDQFTDARRSLFDAQRIWAKMQCICIVNCMTLYWYVLIIYIYVIFYCRLSL